LEVVSWEWQVVPTHYLSLTGFPQFDYMIERMVSVLRRTMNYRLLAMVLCIAGAACGLSGASFTITAGTATISGFTSVDIDGD
jgi:hypothetical protein